MIAAGLHAGIPIFSQAYFDNIIPPAAPDDDQENEGDENNEMDHDRDAEAPVDAGVHNLELPVAISLQDFTRYFPALTHSSWVTALLRAYHYLYCEGHILRVNL